MIDISHEDLGTLCICALRYCHGRRTYMPKLVQEIVASHLEDLSDNDIGIIMNDKEYQERFSLFGSDLDKESWMNFYEKLESFSLVNDNDKGD